MVKEKGVARRVTAIIPVCDAEKWLPSSIPSIFDCMRVEDEIIFIDDNSSDRSFDILQKFALHDTRVKVLKNPNKGLVNALNFGIASAKNEYIARFDSDDLYDASRIDLQLELINQGYALVFSDYEIIDEMDRILGRFISPTNSYRAYLSLLASRRTAHPVALFSKTVFYEVGGYLLEDFPNEDLSLWLRIGNIHEISSVPRSLLKYRIHKKAVSATLRKRQKAGVRKMARKYFSEDRLLQLNKKNISNDEISEKTNLEQAFNFFDSFSYVKMYPLKCIAWKIFIKDTLILLAKLPNSLFILIKLLGVANSKKRSRK